MAKITETGVSRVALATGGAAGDAVPVDATNPLPLLTVPSASAGGTSGFRRIATADTNLAVVKASAGRVYGYVISNPSAAVKFVRLYNKATAPVIAADSALIQRTIMIPAGGIAAYYVGMGIGGFTSGIGIAATGAIGDTDATALTAGDLIIHIDYA